MLVLTREKGRCQVLTTTLLEWAMRGDWYDPEVLEVDEEVVVVDDDDADDGDSDGKKSESGKKS